MSLSQTDSITVALGDRQYAIHIRGGLIGEGVKEFTSASAQHALIVTNTTVASLYGKTLANALQGKFSVVNTVVLPDGEEYKTWETLQLVFDALLSNGCDRKTVLFALGGGVVGDITGFAAACYMRGVPFVQVPTTLLAQVDSSVGGKTAINHSLGKNMIGAFYQPQLVLCDLDVLDTLPPREFSAGLAEVIKYGPIADMAFFRWMEDNVTKLVGRDRIALGHAVRRSCEIKAAVVSADEREGGIRAILNFGHTFGHAIEAGMGYGTWLHGEGVAAGMVMAGELSRRLGLVDEEFLRRLIDLIVRAGLPIRGPIIDPSDNAGRYLKLMRVDKKAEAGEIRYVVIDSPGTAALRTAPEGLVREVIDYCCA